MYPSILLPLRAPLQTLPHVGPKTAERLTHFIGPRLWDLCWHLPDRLETRSYHDTLKGAPLNQLITLPITTVAHYPPERRTGPYKVLCKDERGVLLTLLFFHARAPYLQQMLPLDQQRLVSGLLENKGGALQMAHPDHIGFLSKREKWTGVLPLYGLTAGLYQKSFQDIMEAVLKAVPVLPEWISPALKERFKWKSWRESLVEAHHPKTLADLEPTSPARERLAFDELLAHQLSMGLLRRHHTRQKGVSLQKTGALEDQINKNIPFSLTKNQQEVLKDIETDMRSDSRMLRLLQGDVGSGKTVVALKSMVHAVEAGVQAALLAPTELLARQHYQMFQDFTQGTGLNIGLFLGHLTSKEKKGLQQDLESGHLDMAIGTHALLEDPITFKTLGFVVIDEQHRFGVNQRLKLMEKGITPDVLVMTATPIPRSLSLTTYGELSLSLLKEKPANRLPIQTTLISLDRIQEVHEALKRIVEKGEKVYWVCPLIEESETLDLGHATARFEILQKLFGNQVGWIHGRMGAEEKESVLTAFKTGGIKILVSTTVVEVGVHVGDATVMVVEHAERFGLAQLHQLRGRVGRGDKPSFCLLLHNPRLNPIAFQRLKVMRETEDGFYIAEKDLRLRGSGELLGTKQSGLPNFHVASILDHEELLVLAAQEATRILKEDPTLSTPAYKPLRILLHLFQQEKAVAYLGAG